MTKKLLYVLFLVFLGFACQKQEKIDDNNNNNNPNQSTLKFTDLVATDSVLRIGSLIDISAIASGENISYTWISKDPNNDVYGTFFGSGSDVKWAVCHADVFYISCTVTDKHNKSETKTISIRVNPTN